MTVALDSTEPPRVPASTQTPLPLPSEGAPGAVRPADLPRAELEAASAEHVLRWAVERFGDGLALVTSFQAEGMVLLDMARRIRREVRVITIDTGRLPAETHAFVDRVRERYGLEIEVVYPDPVRLAALVRGGGPNLFYRSVVDRRACCRVRKVEPLERALSGLDAWVTGLRRAQTPARLRIPKLGVESGSGGTRVKVAPLADWSHERVWRYLDEHEVPRHPLYARGYTSIGCAPCTRPTHPGESSRDGRWWWEGGGVRECGLHWSFGEEEPAGVNGDGAGAAAPSNGSRFSPVPEDGIGPAAGGLVRIGGAA